MLRTILICKLIDLCLSRVFARIEHVTRPHRFSYKVGDRFRKLTDTTVSEKGSAMQSICVTMFGATITCIDDGWITLSVTRKIVDVYCSPTMNMQLHTLLSGYGYTLSNAADVRTRVCEYDECGYDVEDFENILANSL